MASISTAPRGIGTTQLPNRVAPTGQQHAPAVPSAAQRLQALDPAKKAQFQAYIAARSGAPAAAGAPITGATSLGGIQSAQYGAAENRANEAYRSAISDNQFQQGQLQNSYLPQFRDMQTRFGLERDAQPSQFIGRGILGSGLDHRNLQQLDVQQLRQHTDLTNQEAGGLATLKNARNTIESNRAQALAQIQAQRQQALAQLALRQIQ